MRDHAYGIVMLLRAKPERAGADFFEQLEEGRDARVAIGRRCCWLAGVRRIGDERVGGIAEEIGVGLRDAGYFPAGHGMATEEERGAGRGKIFSGSLCDAELGAAGVGDEGVLGGVASDFWEKIDCDADGESDVDQIGSAEGGG